MLTYSVRVARIRPNASSTRGIAPIRRPTTSEPDILKVVEIVSNSRLSTKGSDFGSEIFRRFAPQLTDSGSETLFRAHTAMPIRSQEPPVARQEGDWNFLQRGRADDEKAGKAGRLTACVTIDVVYIISIKDLWLTTAEPPNTKSVAKYPCHNKVCFQRWKYRSQFWTDRRNSGNTNFKGF